MTTDSIARTEPLSFEQARLETKCIGDSTALERFLNWLWLHPAGFSRTYPDRIVNNLYFDSMQYDCLEENFAGISSRTKYRIRWYGRSRDVHRAVFEIKRKHNRFGDKLRYPVSFPASLFQLSFGRIRSELIRQLPGDARPLFLQHSEPAIINEYRRRYLGSRDREIRITIDTDLSVFDQRFGLHPRRRLRANTPDLVILECKFSAGRYREVEALVRELPGRVSKSSKYAIGLGAAAGF